MDGGAEIKWGSLSPRLCSPTGRSKSLGPQLGRWAQVSGAICIRDPGPAEKASVLWPWSVRRGMSNAPSQPGRYAAARMIFQDLSLIMSLTTSPKMTPPSSLSIFPPSLVFSAG